ASSVAEGLRQKAAIGAAENDGGYNASVFNIRVDAPNADRADQSACPDHQRAAGPSARLGSIPNRDHQPAQHPQRSGAAGPEAVRHCRPPCRCAPAGIVLLWSKLDVLLADGVYLTCECRPPRHMQLANAFAGISKWLR